MNEEEVLFICQCGDTEHQLIMRYEEDDVFDDVYCSVFLSPEYRWYKRVWFALKYIFGYKCKYGHFDEFIFKPKDYIKLQKVVEYLKNIYDKNERNKTRQK